MENTYITKEQFEKMIATETDRQAAANFGRLNLYRCPNCSWFVVTVDTDPGVTPAFLICENPQHANEAVRSALGAAMASAFYRPPAWIREANASFEWFRPSYEVYLTIKHQPTADFIAEGGLLFRKIGSDRVDGHEIIFEGEPVRQARKPKGGTYA